MKLSQASNVIENIRIILLTNMQPTQEQLNNWYEHKSNKERTIEQEEIYQDSLDEIQEDTTSMEEKLEQ
jgi:hypothetical protein